MADYKPVVFEDSQGNTISNDPVYLAQKVLEARGIPFNGSQHTDLESQLRQAAEGEGSPTDPIVHDDPDADIEESEDDEPRDYTDLSGKALGAYAKERGLSLKDDEGNTKKVGAIRTELMDLDKAQAESDGE